jgi:serine/threonine protein kinase
MSVSSGEHLGPYEIKDRLGIGGMGEVFRAQDTRLGRSVAVKVSSERFNERFEREARLIAALNHPNICTLYDVGPDYLVMELVEGPTLADRIADGPIPLEEALTLARQIAEALRAAHEKGIIHRDLKPVNIKLKPDGTVKVLDFGLATATSVTTPGVSTAESPTFTMGSTQVGAILGTAGYMAPEQARGRPVDKRADIWAFGVILYEMMTGSKLFEAETVSDSLAAVLTKDPDLNRVPFQVRRLLRSCLQKDPKQRLSDIGDAFLLIDGTPATSAPLPGPPPRFRSLWPAVAALAVLGSVATWWLSSRTATLPAETLRFQVAAPEKVTLVNSGVFALSPDGRKLVFSAIENGEQKLWLRSLDSLEAHTLPGTNMTRPAPMFWSPDSRFVAFEADNKLKKIDVNGGPPDTICDLPAGGGTVGGSWNRDNVIIFGNAGNPVMRVSAGGGTPAPVTAFSSGQKGYAAHVYPVFLPDEKHFLYIRFTAGPGDSDVYLGSLDSKPEQQADKPLFHTQSSVSYVPAVGSGTGRLLFARDGTLFAQGFNLRSFALEGAAQQVQEKIGLDSNWRFAMVSATARDMVYRSGGSDELQLTWVDRSGRPLGVVDDPGHYQALVLSRDGNKAASVRRDDGGNLDIWLDDLKAGTSTRFTFDPAADFNPVWSPDGSRLIFVSGRDGAGFYEKSANGAASETLLLKPIPANNLTDWSHDGRFLISCGAGAIWVVPVEGDHKPIPFLRNNFNAVGARLSPDGRWIAYRSTESGRNEIYVESFAPAPDAGSAASTGKWMVSRNGGEGMIHWRQDGKELFYLALDGGVMSVPIIPSPSFHAGTPERLFSVPQGFMRTATAGTAGDVSPDGQKFLLALPKSGERQEFTVVTNWQSSSRTEDASR